MGQDGIYFSEKGYDVTATDLFIETVNKTIREKSAQHIKTTVVDLRNPFTFANESYDIVFAHLSLHYFDQETTRRIFDDIYRVLKPGGVLAFLMNSTSDPEYATGTRIEDDYYQIEGVAKRFFSVESLKPYLAKFNITLLDAQGETYKDKAIGVHNLIRVIATKL